MLCSNSEAINYSRMLLSCYPSSVPADPEAYISLIVSVFVNFEKEVVAKAVSPGGIPGEITKFLPTIGEINNWLNKRAEHAERMSRYAALPLPEFKPTVVEHANLFVPDSVEGYQDMVDRAKKAPDKYHRYERGHVCVDGEIKDGIWVLNLWWEEKGGKRKSSGLPLQVPSDLLGANTPTNTGC